MLTAKYTWSRADRTAHRKATEFHRSIFAPMTFTQKTIQFGWVALLGLGTMFLALAFVDNEQFFHTFFGDNYSVFRKLLKKEILISSWIITIAAIFLNGVLYRSIMGSFFNISKDIEYSLEMTSEAISQNSEQGPQKILWHSKTGTRIWKNWLFVATPSHSFVIPIETMNMPAQDAIALLQSWSKTSG
ncbi:MAG: hypothetical protein COB08_014355 [Rhodobacteraceae bacterium]|nr:hypothetical protein [Paracoccaceae bacterium]